jgi:hypothetical protein
VVKFLGREKSVFVAQVFTTIGLPENNNSSRVESPSLGGRASGHTKALAQR